MIRWIDQSGRSSVQTNSFLAVFDLAGAKELFSSAANLSCVSPEEFSNVQARRKPSHLDLAGV